MADSLQSNTNSDFWKNRIGLPQTAVDALDGLLRPLDQLSWDLRYRILRYLLDDEDHAVLADLAARPGASELLQLPVTRRDFSYRATVPLRSHLFHELDFPNAVFWLRLARVFEAASRPSARRISDLFHDPSLIAVEILLYEATRPKDASSTERYGPSKSVTAPVVEEMIRLAGQSEDALVRAAFLNEEMLWLVDMITHLDGFSECAARRTEVIVAALAHTNFLIRTKAVEIIAVAGIPINAFVEEIADVAVSPNKSAREGAIRLMQEESALVRPALEAIAAKGSSSKREQAIRLLWSLYGEDVRVFLTSRRPVEKSQSCQEALTDLLRNAPPESSAPSLDLPPLPAVQLHAPLGKETFAAWMEWIASVNDGLIKCLSQFKGNPPFAPVDPAAAEESFRLIQAPLPAEPERLLAAMRAGAWHAEVKSRLPAFWRRPEVQLIHFIRFLQLTLSSQQSQSFQTWRDVFVGFYFDTCMAAFLNSHRKIGLREVGAALAAAGLDDAIAGEDRIEGVGVRRGALDESQCWPYWAEHLDLLACYLEVPGSPPIRYMHAHFRSAAFEALAGFPHLPERFIPWLWDLALGAAKADRALAQRCLARAEDRTDRLITTLSSGKASRRSIAAEWLGRMSDVDAIKPLQNAFQKEADDSAKEAMMDALAKLGVATDAFLNREELLQMSIRDLAKGIPDDLAWFPFDQLPKLHWQDSDANVAPEVLRNWVVQNYRRKNPEPGALLRRYCLLLRKEEREALGQFVLEAWIAWDTTPISREEAESLAQSVTQSVFRISHYQAGGAGPGATAQPVKALDEYYAACLQNMLVRPKGSGIGGKGVLAIAAACAGAVAGPIVHGYLKQWYGTRAAQCRALLQMLSWVESPAATQVLLATASRFRTRSIQDEAGKQVQALSERKGWTPDELNDRTIPSAGLDDRGVLILDYGPRQFIARLDSQLALVLLDSEGNKLKSLPEPRRDDDAEQAALSKKLFSNARKELKGILTMQRDRLYEAMCTQRSWRFSEWDEYLNRHPIVRHFTPCLVWAEMAGESPRQLFRPLSDGSLTDLNDEGVQIAPDAMVRIAHQTMLSESDAQSWSTHLSDYRIVPLFRQFGLYPFKLSEEQAQEATLTAFEGYVVETFKLRGRAAKLGYLRGATQDGGWFYEYRKRFSGIGLEAVIEFTGNRLPEENRKVALKSLSFSQIAPGQNALMNVLLGDVPAVLLSECWNDFRAFADDGPGFDPKWPALVQ